VRERKREWPVIVYKFWARPLGDVPEELWSLAREMNNLWNALLDARASTRDQAALVNDKEQKKAIWNAFWVAAQQHARRTNLNWEIKEEVFGRFIAASRRAVKEQWKLKPHHSLRRVMVPHRFSGGGIPIARLFNLDIRAKRLKIRSVSPNAYLNNHKAARRQRLTRGIFGLSASAKIEFETILHRTVPAEAIVKKALWVGEFNRSLPPLQRWTWSLQLVCEIPEERYRYNPQNIDRPSCGLDLGWRVMQGGEYLRIGMIVDTLGRVIELRLPLNMRRKRDENKQGWVSSLHDLIAFDSKVDLELEAAKKNLLQILTDSPEGFEKMRQNGLRKLLRETDDQKVTDLLTEWEQRNNRLCAIRATVHRRIRRRKSWLYQNLAAWLATTYSSVIYEGNFSLKLLTVRGETPAFRNAAKYRQWAGLGELRTAIRNAARKYGSEIIEAETFNTTRRCFVCSAEYKGDKAELYLTCPNGHRWDQDINAASNLLLLQGHEDAVNDKKLRTLVDTSSENPLSIPAILQKLIVSCSFHLRNETS